MKLNEVAKSLTAALIAGAGALQTAATDGLVTTAEWVYVATVTILALGIVWAVPNTTTAPIAATLAEAPAGPEPFTRVNP